MKGNTISIDRGDNYYNTPLIRDKGPSRFPAHTKQTPGEWKHLYFQLMLGKTNTYTSQYMDRGRQPPQKSQEYLAMQHLDNIMLSKVNHLHTTLAPSGQTRRRRPLYLDRSATYNPPTH